MNNEILTTDEFKKRIREHDIVCILAQAFAYSSMGADFNLANKKEYIINRYIEKAHNTIDLLKKHNLTIIYESKK